MIITYGLISFTVLKEITITTTTTTAITHSRNLSSNSIRSFHHELTATHLPPKSFPAFESTPVVPVKMDDRKNRPNRMWTRRPQRQVYWMCWSAEKRQLKSRNIIKLVSEVLNFGIYFKTLSYIVSCVPQFSYLTYIIFIWDYIFSFLFILIIYFHNKYAKHQFLSLFLILFFCIVIEINE